MIKLLVIVGNLGRGGAEKQLLSLLRHHDRAKIVITLLNIDRVQGEYWEAQAIAYSAHYQLLGLGNSHIGRLRALHSLIRELKPDIVWAWHFFTGLYALPFRYFYRSFKLVQGIRNDVDYLLSVHRWAFWLLRRADAVVTNTHQALRQLGEREPALPAGYVLPNSVDVPDAIIDIKAAVEVVGFCGNIHERKGIDVFLHAAVLVVQAGYKGLFVVAGKGDITPYQQLADTLELSDRVEFRGDVECSCEIRHFDIFVLPSRHEGCPNVLLEAMGSGVPSVATHVGGVAEVVNHGQQGLLCESESPQALAHAISRMINDISLRRHTAAKARVAVEYRTESLIAQRDFMQILEAIHAQ